ncbi:hypothetical protein BGW36DRAFT_301641 [Talaromyces proteolyticus]|uniref:Uncharacterized protein n=1 Tax=Talaromyces proteolyticus TaxID=1131652 RepID=A0AAD4PX23_9EURO|nr:uncharacterized protein BGW36DRAFT_301641 [Talaromyces proteolyticus]KAH8692641.1 hypothetical protein BGW36DRAFT_301641 [Talaromyces proteolyticus]
MASEQEGEAATVPMTNGELHPPSDESPALSTPGKRKRAASPERIKNNEPTSAEDDKAEVDQTLRDLLQILSRDDENLNLFKCTLIPPSPSKPRSKRAKLSEESNTIVTIEARVAAGRYASLQEFVDDIDKASVTLIEKQQAGETEYDENSLQKQVQALKKHLHSLLAQVSSRKTTNIKTESAGEIENLEDVAAHHTVRQDKKVLTLYGGNSTNAKQLFSSLPNSDDTQPVSEKAEPFPEGQLPNGITITQVIPFNLDMDEKPAKTFGEVFAPRSTLPQLEPPRHGRPWARDPSIMWIDEFDAATNFDAVLGQKHHYSFTHLPASHWVQYGGHLSSSFWRRRQKQHDSEKDGESATNGTSSDSTKDEANLFQSVYTSFGPSVDSSHAVTQLDEKNAVWWAKRGSRRFNTMLSLHNATSSQGEQLALDDLDESTLEEDIKSFNPDIEDKDKSEIEPSTEDDKAVDDVLRDVAELLETLDSFRRNRNLELPTQAGSKDENSADAPSTAELATYETLKSSLAAIIANLPPYAVSKLNGDQLAELNISQKILVEGPSYSGTMEEDDYSLLQKRIVAAAPAATPSRSGSYQASPAFNQRLYSTNSRPQQSAVGGQPYYPGRQSTSTPYTPGGTPHQNYPGPRPQASPSQRPNSLPGYPSGQYPPRPTPNGYNSYAGHPGASPSQGYQQSPYGAGRSASPQKPHMYATPQNHTRTAYLNPASGNPQRYYPQQPGQSPAMHGNYSSTQTPTQYSNSAAAANYARSAAEQAMLMAQNKAQIAAQVRQTSGTPNPPQSAEQSSVQEGSASPAIKANATPTPTAT